MNENEVDKNEYVKTVVEELKVRTLPLRFLFFDVHIFLTM